MPDSCQWATFLRNHDEVDLGRLVGHEHDEVFAAFGPDPDDAALRPRHPPAAGADARQRSAPHRDGLRPAVQPARHAGHPLRRRDRHGRGPAAPRAQRHPHPDAVERRTARRLLDGVRKRDLRRPVITGGEFGYENVNVEDQQRDPGSLLGLVPASAADPPRVPGVRRRHVHATSTPATGRCSRSSTTRRAVHARGRQPRRRSVTIDLGPQDVQDGDRSRSSPTATTRRSLSDLNGIDIGPYGYRWIRLRRTIGARAGSSTQH